MTYSYTTAELVQAELRADAAFSVSTNPTLSSITTWITEASDEINHIAGKVFGETEYTELIDYNGVDRIYLKHSPIITVSSVLYSKHRLGSTDYDLSEAKVENTDYYVDSDRGYLGLLLSNWKPVEGKRRIQVTYTAGHTVTPPKIQMLATKMVALRVLETLLRYDMNEGNVGGSTSVGSINIVEPAEYGVQRFKALRDDIENLKKEITGVSIYRYTNY